MDNPCGVAVTLRQVITEVAVGHGVSYEKIPFPDGVFYTVEVAATVFGVKSRTLWNELSEKRGRFDAPMYRPDAQRRRRRILSEHDMAALALVFKIAVKRKATYP